MQDLKTPMRDCQESKEPDPRSMKEWGEFKSALMEIRDGARKLYSIITDPGKLPRMQTPP